MPVGATAGFDLLFGISARTFGAMIEGIIRPRIFANGPPVPVTGGTLNFDDFRVEAWFGTATQANGVEIRFGFLNATFSSDLVSPVSLGSGWSDFFVPATLASVPAGTGFVDIILTLNFASTTFDADNEAPLVQAGLTEQMIASAFQAGLTGAGLTNPVSLTNGTFIAVVPRTPAAAPGVFPGVSVVTPVVQRRPANAAPGEEAVAFLFTFQARPDTPGTALPGNPANLPPLSFAVGQSLLLNIGNAFLFELLASLALEASGGGGLGVPPVLVTANATGITLNAPAPVTLGGTAGSLTVFTLGAPAAGTTSLPLALTFTFVMDFITYTVAITGATLTIGMSGGAMVVSSVIPPANVTYDVPWWVALSRILAGAALGVITGNVVIGIGAAIVGGLSVIAEGAIVSAIVGPTASLGVSTATSGLGGGLLPPAITAMIGGGTLAPPLVFDDLQVGGAAILPDPVKLERREPGIAAKPGGLIDFDTGEVSLSTVGIGLAGAIENADLGWDDMFGLTAAHQVSIVPMSGQFSTIGYEDVSAALTSGAVSSLPANSIPLVSQSELLISGQFPRGKVFGVKTSRGKLAKVLAWRDRAGTLVLRYELWNASEASVRIYPYAPFWRPMDFVESKETHPKGGKPATTHRLLSSATTVNALVHRMNGPISFNWYLDDFAMVGDDEGIIAGKRMSWSINGARLDLRTGLGESLERATLVCEAIGAGGVRASDSIQLSVVGRSAGPATNFGGVVEGLRENLLQAFEESFTLPPLAGEPGLFQPFLHEEQSLLVDVGLPVKVGKLRTAIKTADEEIDIDSMTIR